MIPKDEILELVSDDGCLVSRQLYSDDALYRLEQDRIFGRAWLFLGHESQVQKPGDFFTAFMGEESVIVSRDRKGALHANLNTCRHRGLRVCRADRGNAHSHVCPYHGWTYGSDGELKGMPDARKVYGDDLDKKKWGLVPVAQLDSYLGLIFATFDPGAPSLGDYLGDMRFFSTYSSTAVRAAPSSWAACNAG